MRKIGTGDLRSTCWYLLVLQLLAGMRAHADVTLFVEAPINFFGHLSSTGRAAFLVDDLCSDDHVHMRL